MVLHNCEWTHHSRNSLHWGILLSSGLLSLHHQQTDHWHMEKQVWASVGPPGIKSQPSPKAPSIKWRVFKKYIFIYFIYFWLCWVLVAAHGLSLVEASGGYSSLQCAGFSLWWFLLLRSTGSRCVGFSSCGTQAQ